MNFSFIFCFLFVYILEGECRYLVPVGLIFLLVFIGGMLNIDNPQVNVVTNPLLFEFSFGIMSFYFIRKFGSNKILGMVLIVVSIMTICFVNVVDPFYSRIVIYGIPAWLFFLGMMSLEPLFKKNSSNVFFKSLKGIGDSSYSLYLFHPFSLVIFSIFLSYLDINDFGYIFVILLMISSVVSGHLCYLFLEKPLLKFTKNNDIFKRWL